MTSELIAQKLNRAKRKWQPCDELDYALIFCEKCGKLIGKRNMYFRSVDTEMYCEDCVKDFITPSAPVEIAKGYRLTEDRGNYVDVFYEGNRAYYYLDCHFNSKGRFVKIKGKRYYV